MKSVATAKVTRFGRQVLLVLACLVAWSIHSDISFGQDDRDEVLNGYSESFQLGGSCAGLAYLENAQLRTLTGPSFKDEFPSFCYPEEPFDCSDYSSLLKGIGSLEPGLDGYYCRLVVK